MALIWQITERAFIHVQKNTSLNRLKALFRIKQFFTLPYDTRADQNNSIGVSLQFSTNNIY